MDKYGSKKWEDFDITKDELNSFKEAFKKEEFIKLFSDYVEEISSPENKALYEKEITELEKERGVEVTFINPVPGFVLKTSVDGFRKAFINVCSNEKVGEPVSAPGFKNGNYGLDWSLPYLLAPPKEDLDKNRQKCVVYDVVFHPDSLHIAKKSKQIHQLIIDVSLSAVEDSFKVQLDRKNVRFPKCKYKGVITCTVIRRKIRDLVTTASSSDSDALEFPYPYDVPEEKAPTILQPRTVDATVEFTTPKHKVVYRKGIDMYEFTYSRDAKMEAATPSEIVVEVELPLVREACDVKLDVAERKLVLNSNIPGSCYRLELELSYPVDEEKGRASWIKESKLLKIELPVVRSKAVLGREDSGIETEESGSPPSPENERSPPDSPIEEDSEFWLHPQLHYSLPQHALVATPSSLVLKLLTPALDPSSFAHRISSTSPDSLHLKFSSIGSGLFPLHFAATFCLPTVDLTPVTILPSEKEVQITIPGCPGIKHYFFGLNPLNLTEYSLTTEELKLCENLQNLEISSEHTFQEPHMSASPPESSLEETTASCRNFKKRSKSESDEERKPERTPNLRLLKKRTKSESEGTVGGLRRRSILKIPERSLSESLDWSATCMDPKHVTFSDVISKKIFRANSSILGQKKKNRRKKLGKKRAEERRASLSASESENESVSSSCCESSTGESSSDSELPPPQTLLPSTKVHRKGGKKNQRKDAALGKLTY